MNNLITKINELPDELINIIKDYIPKIYLVFVNKTDYLLYHYILKTYITKYEDYIRRIIILDYDFVFKNIVRDNYNKWLKMKNVMYKNFIFKNYIYFIINFCIENDSSKCYIFIKHFLHELGLCKNQHKKNIVNYIKWKN